MLGLSGSLKPTRSFEIKVSSPKPSQKKWLQQFEDDAVKLPASKDAMPVKATGVDECSTPASEKSAPDSKRLKVKKKKSSGKNGSRGGSLVKRTLAAVENNALPDGMSKVAAGKLVRELALKAAALATEANALNKHLHPGGGGTNCSLTVTSNEGEQTTSGQRKKEGRGVGSPDAAVQRRRRKHRWYWRRNHRATSTNHYCGAQSDCRESSCYHCATRCLRSRLWLAGTHHRTKHAEGFQVCCICQRIGAQGRHC